MTMLIRFLENPTAATTRPYTLAFSLAGPGRGDRRLAATRGACGGLRPTRVTCAGDSASRCWRLARWSPLRFIAGGTEQPIVARAVVAEPDLASEQIRGRGIWPTRWCPTTSPAQRASSADRSPERAARGT